MKTHSLKVGRATVCAIALLLSASVQAVENHNSSRSNKSSIMQPGSPDPVAACNEQCGRLTQDASGKQICTVPPAPECWSTPAAASSKGYISGKGGDGLAPALPQRR